MTSSRTDEDYMKLALRLARRGLGRTSPNPMVGAVIVREGRIIGRGYHHHFGGDHAEVDAIKRATESLVGATLYVTLEPCSHLDKKTPPCTEAILRSGIARVVAGSLDPNPRVRGRGLEILKQRGLKTKVGVLEQECRALNEAFFKYMNTGIPLVTVKFASTLDGRIATTSGSSKWISSEASLKLAHQLRAVNDAVMVGIGTVLADDPELTVRLVKGRNPARIVVDSTLRIPLDSRLVKTSDSAKTIVATTHRASPQKAEALRRSGVEVLTVPRDADGEVHLGRLLGILGERGFTSVLVEGGAGIITAMLGRGLADRLVAIVAPKILGKGIEAVGELHITDVGQAIKLSFRRVYRRGADLVIEADIQKEGQYPFT